MASFRIRQSALLDVNGNGTAGETSLQLSPPPESTSNPADDIFRSARRRLPKKIQYFLRDSGMLRAAMDTCSLLAIWEICNRYPSALSAFLELTGISPCPNNRFERNSYGSHARQYLDIMRPTTGGNENLVVFVHGGAWGSGFPLLYRLTANTFLKQGSSVAVLGYRTYPSANVDGQVDDVTMALHFLRTSIPEFSNVVFVGHSTGAHLGALGILRGDMKVDRFVGISGVYDIQNHYSFERGRGIERISPLAPACGGSIRRWKASSPLQIVEGSSYRNSKLPPIMLVHGEKDSTVPYSSSSTFFQALRHCNAYGAKGRVSLEILPGVGHADTVVHLMFGGPTQDTVLEWLGSTIPELKS